jgi:hypothetical protein
MRSFSGPNTANFKSKEETQMTNFEGNAITVASADEYLDLAAPATEEARKAANDYIETYFGVYGTDEFKSAEYASFTEEVEARSLERTAGKPEVQVEDAPIAD